MNTDFLAVIVVIAVVLFAVLGIVIYITRPDLRHGAGGLFTSFFGATDGFLTKDKTRLNVIDRTLFKLG